MSVLNWVKYAAECIAAIAEGFRAASVVWPSDISSDEGKSNSQKPKQTHQDKKPICPNTNKAQPVAWPKKRLKRFSGI